VRFASLPFVNDLQKSPVVITRIPHLVESTSFSSEGLKRRDWAVAAAALLGSPEPHPGLAEFWWPATSGRQVGPAAAFVVWLAWRALS